MMVWCAYLAVLTALLVMDYQRAAARYGRNLATGTRGSCRCRFAPLFALPSAEMQHLLAIATVHWLTAGLVLWSGILMFGFRPQFRPEGRK